jgi:hypothetical protein
MALKLRRIIWSDDEHDAQREDFEVIDERGERIGRMYRTNAVGGGHDWRRTVSGLASYDVPPAGLEPTREKAMAAFKVGWARCKPRERGA